MVIAPVNLVSGVRGNKMARRVGLRINIAGDEIKLSGEGIDNLKNEIKGEIIEEIQREIIKPENDKIKEDLANLKDAISNNDRNLLKKTLKKLIEKGTDVAVEVLVKIIQAKFGL